jgi:hypothetical protein
VTRHITEFEKKRIAKTLGLVDPAPSLQKIDVAARRYWRDYDANESKYKNIELIERLNGKLALKLERRRYEVRRRPPRLSLRAYLTAIMAIYERATDKKITRIVYSGGDKRAGQHKRHPFVVACLRAVGVHSYPTGIVRQIIEKNK